MRIRPWPIVILALAHILAPIANFFYSAWLMHHSAYFYFLFVFSHGRWHRNLAHFVGYPVAGLAIYKTNRWSYPIFLAVMSWMLYSNVMTWREFPQYFGLSSLLLTFVLNLGVVSYFLIPEVRNVYFNPKLRWWEHKPRYDVTFPGYLQSLESEKPGVVQNISEGGAFVQSDLILFSDCEVDLRFEAMAKQHAVKARVVHVRRANPTGYGLQFVHTPATLAAMKELIREIKDSGAYERLGNVNLAHEFMSWFRTTLRTGKGLVPVIDSRAKPAPQSEDRRRNA